MNEEIQPCPFCGKKPVIREAEYDGEFMGYVFKCEGCGCNSIAYESMEEAKTAWNTRAPNVSENELVKLLATLVDAYHDELSARSKHICAIHRAKDFLKDYADTYSG